MNILVKGIDTSLQLRPRARSQSAVTIGPTLSFIVWKKHVKTNGKYVLYTYSFGL